MNTIIAVIVTYNRKKLLEKCIDANLGQSYDKFDIVVIDNASTDGTEELVKSKMKQSSRLFYENTKANLGGAGGFSYGVKWAVNKGYDYIWLMDDDTIPDVDCLEKLLNADKLLDGKYGFLSSYAKWTDGKPCEMNVPSISQRWRNTITEEFDNSIIALDSASFVSMFIRRTVIETYGLPIKEFFIWGDDVEYSKRISQKTPGYFVYDSQVVHEMASNRATTISDETNKDRLGRYKYLYRNLYYIAKKGAKREKILFWLRVKNDLKAVRKSSEPHKFTKSKIIIKSAVSGLFFKPKVEFVKYNKK